MRQTFNLVLGTDLVAAVLPDGRPIYGVQVDNPTGYWLTVLPSGQSVPPYMQGWALVLAGVPNVDVRFSPIQGPAGQVVTKTGDPVIVTLVDEDENVGDTNGTPFIEAFTQVLSVQLQGKTMGLSGNTFVVVAPIPTKRIRILTAEVDMAGGAFIEASSPANFVWQEHASLTRRVSGMVAWINHPLDVQIFPLGLDCTLGEGIDFAGNGIWSDVVVNMTLSYQAI